MTERIAILGSTGSVGLSTLDVVRRHPDRFRVSVLAANSNVDQMLAQCLEFRPRLVVMADGEAAMRLRTGIAARGLDIELSTGTADLDAAVAEGVDSVVCAIVGAVGLSSTLAAVRAGCRVLVANKEPLVMLGPAIMSLARRHQATVLPLDSEHNAIFQCLPGNWQNGLGDEDNHRKFGVKRLLLTGSGGPFRQLDMDGFHKITPRQACAHPNWDMGPKISVDSATMMNKGLELIEACSLFAIDQRQVEVVIHPQSVVHSMVEYIDGSVIAQMANPDMRVPIANALGWPHRIESGAESLNLFSANRFDFAPPDLRRFPALGLAREVAEAGGTAPAVMNAANEVAVAAFLDGRIRFDQIVPMVAETLAQTDCHAAIDLELALEADRLARLRCQGLVAAAAA